MDLYYYLACFLIYAFLGWCAEVAFAAVNQGKFVNRGFLNGPVCPIYGTGMVIIIYCLTPLMSNKILLFFGSVVLTTILEWIVGFVLEKLFHQKWWDYSELPFNLNGYVCLKFSLMWGFGGLIIMDVIHPITDKLIYIVPHLLGVIVLSILTAFLLADALVTVRSILKLNKRLGQLDDMAKLLHTASDEIGENLFEGVTAAMEKSEGFRLGLEERKEALEEKKEALEGSVLQRKAALEAKKAELYKDVEALLSKKEFGHRRLLKAFPHVKSNRYQAALQQLKDYINNSKTV